MNEGLFVYQLFMFGLNMKTTALPETMRKYFWDCNFESLSMKAYSFFISERILNFGDLVSIKWLLSQIDKSHLKKVIQKSRNLDKKTRNYWSIML